MRQVPLRVENGKHFINYLGYGIRIDWSGILHIREEAKIIGFAVCWHRPDGISLFYNRRSCPYHCWRYFDGAATFCENMNSLQARRVM